MLINFCAIPYIDSLICVPTEFVTYHVIRECIKRGGIGSVGVMGEGLVRENDRNGGCVEVGGCEEGVGVDMGGVVGGGR